jgi:cell division protein FtsL
MQERRQMKRFPGYQPNTKIRRTRDVNALSRLGLLLFCGLVLTGGFVFAAKQHFAAVQYGYRSEGLRIERKKLLEENQRLSLEMERVTAPARLEPAARRLGLKPARASQIATFEKKEEVEATKLLNGKKPRAASSQTN